MRKNNVKTCKREGKENNKSEKMKGKKIGQPGA